MNLPLSGIKVLDLSTALPGPFCSMMLGDFGAEVLKIEQPKGGDIFRAAKPAFTDSAGKDVSAAYLLVSRNKKSMTLNFKTEAGKKIFNRLVSEADVIIEGSRPGVAKKFGIDYEAVKAVNPQLVYCSISGYGQDGPYAYYSGHDNNYISYAGILAMTARHGQIPTLPGVQIGDIGGGSLMAVIGILLAIMARKHTGQGQFVDIAMLDGAISWLPLLASHFFVTGQSPQPGETRLTGKNACYEVYKTKDGGYLSIGPIEPHLWANLCEYFDKQEFVQWQIIDEKQEEVIAFLREKFLTRNRDEWIEILQKIDVCIAPVLTIAETCRDPQVLHRKMVFEMDHPRLGKIKQLGFPIKLSDTPARAELAPPDLGEHTDEILGKLGYSAEECKSFKQQGIV